MNAGDDYGPLERALGYRFQDSRYLGVALTHRSWAHEESQDEHYERLEFLGDAILGAVTAEWLYRRFDSAEGELSKLKGFLVSAPVLAEYSRRLGLGEWLRLGVGEARSGGGDKESLLADVFEAVVGALFLDGGREVVRGFLEPLLASGLESYREPVLAGDAKTRLQETLQAGGGTLPEYRLVSELGPDHEKTFVVECRADGRVLGSGQGSSKKRAEQEAAAMALETLGA